MSDKIMAKSGKGISREAGMRTLAIPAQPVAMNVSKIILGTAQFGTGVSEEAAFAVLDAYCAAGGRTIDTANIYGRWGRDGSARSEICLGKWFKSRDIRREMQVITKGGHPELMTMGIPRISADCLRQDLADSLNNLQTDYLDIYQLHRDDRQVPVAEIMECLHSFVKSGRVRTISASNWTAARIEEANQYAAAKGLTEFGSSEINFSLTVSSGARPADMPEVTAAELEYYAGRKLPILAWGSLGGGYIIRSVAGELERINPAVLAQYQNAVNSGRIDNVRRVMGDSGLSAEELCVAYITNYPVAMAAIIGASSTEQIKSTMKAADLVIPKALIDELELFLPPE